MHTFSNHTRNILLKAGWYEGRAFDTLEYESLLREKGIVPSDTALNFLREFGGLHMRFPKPGCSELTDKVHFDVLKAVFNEEDWTLRDALNTLEVEACPIGETSGGYVLLFMDATGNVYGEYTGARFFYGHNLDAALETLINGRAILY